MLNEGKADVLAAETLGASDRRHATDSEVADPNARQIAADAPGSYIYITSPGGLETFMEQMSKAGASDPVDMGKVSEAMRKNGIEWRNNRE